MRLFLIPLLSLVVGACGEDAVAPAQTSEVDPGSEPKVDPGFTDPGEPVSTLPPREAPLAVGDPALLFAGRPSADTVVLVFYRGHW